MILADKIIRLRKKNGWSQEEFTGAETDCTVRKVSLLEAHEYLAWRKRASIGIALATYLCIFAVIPLLILGAATEMSGFPLSEDAAGGLGMVFLLLLVTPAVVVFVVIGIKNAPYDFLEKETFETEYGVSGMVKERQKEYRKNYLKNNIIGTCLCVLSPVALFMGAFSGKDFFVVIMLSVTMLVAGAGAMFFIVTGVRWAAMQKLLKEGEFTDTEKEKGKGKGAIALVYWSLATAIYLVWMFVDSQAQRWNSLSWIVWPVAGVLFAGVLAVCNMCMERKDK